MGRFFLEYSDGPNAVFVSEWQTRELKRFEDARLLALRQGMQVHSFLESPEGTQPCQHLHFGPVKSVLDFWPPELSYNKLGLSYGSKFMGLDYSSHSMLVS